MADDVAITAGVGTNVATDEIGGRHFQRTKTALGPDGTAVDWESGAGNVNGGTGRVTLANNDPLVAAIGASGAAAVAPGAAGVLLALMRTLTSGLVAEDDPAANGELLFKVGAVRRQADGGQTSGDTDWEALQMVDGKVKVVVSKHILTNSASFARPANTTTYAFGQTVANSTTAGSVTPMQITVLRSAAGAAKLLKCRLRKSGTTATNAQFKVHFWSAAITSAAGDGAAMSTTGAATYLGSMDVFSMQPFSDGCTGIGRPSEGGNMNIKLASGSVVYCLLQAQAAYAPASGETFELTVESEPY